MASLRPATALRHSIALKPWWSMARSILWIVWLTWAAWVRAMKSGAAGDELFHRVDGLVDRALTTSFLRQLLLDLAQRQGIDDIFSRQPAFARDADAEPEFL